MYSKDRAIYESCIARAHRALWQAEQAAERMRDEGAVSDLRMLQVEVTRLQNASLSGKVRVPKGQLKLA